MADTCQANTLYSKFYSPGILATASSDKGENSYSVSPVTGMTAMKLRCCLQHHSDPDLGVAVIDRYTHVVLNFLESINKTSSTTLQDLFNRYSFEDFRSNAGVRSDLYPRSPNNVKLTEFFGGVAEVDTTQSTAAAVHQLDNTANAPSAKVRLNQARRKSIRTKPDNESARNSSVAERWKPLWSQRFLDVELGAVLLFGHVMFWLLWRHYSTSRSKEVVCR